MTRRFLAAALVLGSTLACSPRCGGGGREPKTIVLVTIDTLRRDRVGAYGAGELSTPRMDAFAAEALRFHDARTPSPLTLPSHTTMLTGLPPAAHGVRSNSASRVPPPQARAFPLLAERLEGRRRGAFVSAAPLSRRYGLDQGFEVYDDQGVDEGHDDPSYAERAGPETVARARAWLAGLGRDEPVFLWVHLFEPHAPHGAGGYDGDVLAADRAFGDLLDALGSLGRGDAVVCLAADHGEALGEHGEATHGLLLGESVLRVPLLLRAPGRRGEVRHDPADLADVAPTLLALAGKGALDLPVVPGVGRDLLAGRAPPDRPRVAEALHAHHQYRWAQLSAAVVGRVKFEDRGEGRERLFVLSDDAPPWQDAGVAAAGRPEAEAPASALRLYRRGDRRPGDDLGGEAPPGYGAGGTVHPFLDPAPNAARPDPYAVVEDAKRIFEIEALLGRMAPEELSGRVTVLERRDRENPYLPFLRGRIERERRDYSAAAAAFERALALGRLDAQTVWQAAGSRADRGDVAGALHLLRTYESRVRPDVWFHLLAAGIHGELGDHGARDAACRKAREAARTERERRRVREACGGD